MLNEYRILRTTFCLLLTVVTGCESFQRKFTRKSKRAVPPPSPIITFEDYTRSTTPLDRYRKHSLMFDYWNSELVEALRGTSQNAKRLKRASSEALNELEALKGLLTEEIASRLEPLIEARAKVDRQMQSPGFATSQAHGISRIIEDQTRLLHREFSWRRVEDQLKQELEVHSPPSTVHRP